MKHIVYLFPFILSGSLAFVPSIRTRLCLNPHSVSSSSFTSSQNSLLARRPLLSEDDLATPPNPKVIEIVEKMGGKNVIASGK